MNRRAVWVGLHGEQRVAVDVLRRYSNRVVCRVVEPGHESNGVVCDFHPADVRPAEQPHTASQH